jgi:hypothetical protein
MKRASQDTRNPMRDSFAGATLQNTDLYLRDDLAQTVSEDAHQAHNANAVVLLPDSTPSGPGSEPLLLWYL